MKTFLCSMHYEHGSKPDNPAILFISHLPRSASWRSQGIKSITKKWYLQSRKSKGQRSNYWLQWYGRSLSV